nr:site-specific integrase [Acidobacteriota bacterium]
GGPAARAGDDRGVHLGRTPGNKGMSYPADPPRVEEIVAVMRQAGSGLHGDRMRGLIVVLWRAGLRISEALDLREGDLEPNRGALLVREGKGAAVARSGWTSGAGSNCGPGLTGA